MTYLNSISTNSLDRVNTSSHQRLSKRTEQLKSLLIKMIPISNESIDRQGNCSRLWSLKNEMFLGTVFHPNGTTSLIPFHKIINPCGINPRMALQRIKNLQGLQLDLTYIPEQKEIIIFPHLRASAIDDQVVQVSETHEKLAYITEQCLNLQPPKPPISWTPPPIDDTPNGLSHMFRNSFGHFSKDTPENRAYILSAVSDSTNKKIVNKHGVEKYFKLMPDGYQAWAFVRNGFVVNGGRSTPWLK